MNNLLEKILEKKESGEPRNEILAAFKKEGCERQAAEILDFLELWDAQGQKFINAFPPPNRQKLKTALQKSGAKKKRARGYFSLFFAKFFGGKKKFAGAVLAGFAGVLVVNGSVELLSRQSPDAEIEAVFAEIEPFFTPSSELLGGLDFLEI